MLTADDIEWIAGNRADITASRTVSVTIIHVSDGAANVYTGEPSQTPTNETVSAVWKEFSTVANRDRDVVAGVELRKGDVRVSFVNTVDLSDVETLTYGGATYAIISQDAKGIGGTNRTECIVRRVT